MESDFSKMQEYVPPSRGRHSTQRRCRLSLRRNGAELALLIPNEVAAEAGIVIGGRARLLFDQDKLAIDKLVIVPAPDGALRIRKMKSGGNIFPHLLVHIGADKPLNCTFPSAGSIACEHTVNSNGLVLVLPETIKLTAHK
jgi:hypothetical protein